MRFAVCIDSLELVIFFTFFFFSEPKKKVTDLQRRILASLSHETVKAWHRAGHVWRRGMSAPRCESLLWTEV